MRRPFFISGLRGGAALLLAGLALAGAAQPAKAGMRGYIVTSFDTIRVEAPVRVILSTGSGVSAMGEGDREALDRVRLSVSGGVLTISMAEMPSGGFSSGGNGEAPALYLETGQVRRALVLGGGTLAIDALNGLEAVVQLNGNGSVTVGKVDVERLILHIGGGGQMVVAGTARDVQASLTGTGSLDAERLVARSATVANNGAGSVGMTVTGPVQIVSTGSGNSVVGGKPICTVTQSGVGSVQCGE